MTYEPNIPTGTLNLDQDYKNIRGNFQTLNTIFGIDHTPFDNITPQKGYHTIVHMLPAAASPTVDGVGELFCQTLNDGFETDQVLFYQARTAPNTVKKIQLTRNLVPSINTNGYSYIAGGLLIQWGKVNSTSNGTVTFSASGNKAFPNNFFQVNTQPFYNGAAPSGNATIAVKLNGLTSFTWNFFTSSSSYNGFFWYAVGN